MGRLPIRGGPLAGSVVVIGTIAAWDANAIEQWRKL